MAFNYTRLRDNTAEPLIANFGRAATLLTPSTQTGPNYNPGTSTPNETAVTVVQTKFSDEYRAATTIGKNDAMYIMSTDGDPAPEIGHKLRVDGVEYQVINVLPLSPGGVTLLFNVHVGK